MRRARVISFCLQNDGLLRIVWPNISDMLMMCDPTSRQRNEAIYLLVTGMTKSSRPATDFKTHSWHCINEHFHGSLLYKISVTVNRLRNRLLERFNGRLIISLWMLRPPNSSLTNQLYCLLGQRSHLTQLIWMHSHSRSRFWRWLYLDCVGSAWLRSPPLRNQKFEIVNERANAGNENFTDEAVRHEKKVTIMKEIDSPWQLVSKI